MSDGTSGVKREAERARSKRSEQITDERTGTYSLGDAGRRAAQIVSKERESHGDAYRNHEQIAKMWTAFLGDSLSEPIRAWQVAIMMEHVKHSRMMAGTLDVDHFVDSSGYDDVALYSALMDRDVEVDGVSRLTEELDKDS